MSIDILITTSANVNRNVAYTLSSLALHIPIENILIPPSAYLRDRQLSPDIHAPYASGRRAFSAKQPLPRNTKGQSRLPRVLRETTSFLLLGNNVNTEGLFRIPAHVKLRAILKEAYDRGQKFIIWKERGVTLPMPKYDHSEGMEATINEIDQTEAYGVHLAAGLLKLWYTQLREPLFPSACYRELKAQFGNLEETPSLEKLTELLSPKSEWSAIPSISREILTRHLLPLLSEVASHSGENRMTPENLAVCFAPTFVCGPDQMEDVKISNIIRRILTAAAGLWSSSLRDACGIDEKAFAYDLQAPARIEDYEDPLDPGSTSEEPQSPGFTEEQKIGIILKDNDVPTDVPPPLPPRQYGSRDRIPTSGGNSSQWGNAPPLPPRSTPPRDSKSESLSEEANVRRKPAPPLMVPPRYSTVAAHPDDVTESPSTYMTPVDGFGPPRRSNWSWNIADDAAQMTGVIRQDSQIKRKPLTPTSPQSDDDKK